jgi:ATP-binding cassette, subfamily B, bacterial
MRTSKENPNVMRDVLTFLFRHWRREAWLVAVVACSMVMATIADLFMPVFAGRMVDAVASHSGSHQQSLHAALFDGLACK